MIVIVVLALTGVVYGRVNLAANSTSNVSPLWIQGTIEANKNDQESTVKCADGYYVSNCFCSDESTCDGTKVVDEKTCVAYHKGFPSKVATKPMVRCKPADGRVVKVLSASGNQLKTSVVCPTGFTMESCMIHNPNAERFNARRVWTVKADRQMTCTWKRGRDISKRLRATADLTAVCVKYDE